MTHFFISYSAADGEPFALKLTTELESGPPAIPVWFDKRRLNAADGDWDDQLDQAIMGSKGLLFVITADSVRTGSVCKNEWVSALGYKKPIIPLRLHADAPIPLRLNAREYIDFSGDFDAALARLRKHLARMDSPEGHLRALQHRLEDAERQCPRVPAERRALVDADIAELRRQIASQQAVVADPEGARQRVQRSIDAGLENERRPTAPPHGTRPGKFINPPPLIAPGWFQNRQAETRQIADFLADDALRMMCVVGRGGIGKSALVCRLLRALESGRLPDDGGPLAVDGIVYLSAARACHRPCLPDLYEGLRRLLPDDIGRPLDALYKAPQTSPGAMAEALAAAFPDGRTVVLLDNFEDLLDMADGAVLDAELDETLRALLLAPPHGLKLILTTRRAPGPLAQVQPGLFRRLDLDTGLAHPYAENILRAMDADGKVGLRDAPDALLAEARVRTLGYPRALEHLFGILSADRDTRLQDILDKTRRYLPEQVVTVLVGEAFGRLDALAQQVMQALASCRYPVPPAAIDYLLHPHVPGIDSAPVLARLYNMQFVRRDAGRYHLHQVDRDYALERLAPGSAADRAGEPPPLTRFGLRHRAAEWFKLSRKPRDAWKSLDDLAAQLAEFDLRCEGEDYETATALLAEFDFDHLFLWGHYRLMAELHERLQGHIADPTLALGSVGNLGAAYNRMGLLDKATTCYERALALARDHGISWAEGTALGNLSVCVSGLGRFADAIAHIEHALTIHREVGDRQGEANDLGNLGNQSAHIGQIDRAIALHEQALALDRECASLAGEASDLCNIGNRRRELGQHAAAHDAYIAGLKIAAGIGFRLVEGGANLCLGELALDARQWAAALDHFALAIETGDALGSAEMSQLGRIGLALTRLLDDDPTGAHDAIEQASRFDDPLSNPQVQAIRGLVALRRGAPGDARDAFAGAAERAAQLIERSADNYAAQDILGLAASGLALDGDPAARARARSAYAAARRITTAPGIVARTCLLFDLLAGADAAGHLAGLRAIAAGEAEA